MLLGQVHGASLRCALLGSALGAGAPAYIVLAVSGRQGCSDRPQWPQRLPAFLTWSLSRERRWLRVSRMRYDTVTVGHF